MIRTAALGLALGATNIHPAGQLVTIGGETWDQPGFTTFYRDPSIVVPSGPERPAHPIMAPVAQHDCNRQVAHMLRSAAWNLDHGRKQPPKEVATVVQKALDMINNNDKQGPGRHDCRDSEVPN